MGGAKKRECFYHLMGVWLEAVSKPSESDHNAGDFQEGEE